MKIENIEPCKIAFFRRTGPYGIENKILMESFKQWVRENNLFEKSTILGIAQDDPNTINSNRCRYDVCLIVTNNVKITPPAKEGSFSGGKYAINQAH
ncbi:GyrI-like domain-containing protein [Sporolactobacillus shoreicorticis]|uniref:GyrI-like domain-containing protein n=1 Tax=Sporolactobacillus shoreicorticis TaxID=1923877 RepID=A0ABW5S6M0_9BACL|nr:GyrI-like domain-containing protein [Sporolactobacillus shoreicorticis]MCO7128358.1 GyrI-like domain-containing protein [Sporolactobacillus shoreicorticis]